MTEISAQTVLSSSLKELPNKRLTTLRLRYPRWIHSEFMTHRALSKNSAYSRALPIEKLIWDAENDPAFPLHIGKHQPGMQAYEELSGLEREAVMALWLGARNSTLDFAKTMHEYGAAKQVVNRLLEPYTHITVVCSGTEWTNFLALRDHHAAEPHMQMLARAIGAELEKDPMQSLDWGEWHLPFINDQDRKNAINYLDLDTPEGSTERLAINGYLIKLSTARCASTSYKTVDGFDMDFERAQKVYQTLVGSTPIHASPAEHVARADHIIGLKNHEIMWTDYQFHRNFVGFCQHRAMISNDTL
jgi:thymidylate synthase ThyX